jgi:hypothetical protein
VLMHPFACSVVGREHHARPSGRGAKAMAVQRGFTS